MAWHNSQVPAGRSLDVVAWSVGNRFKDKCGVEVDPREDVLGATWLASRYQVAGLRARGALCLVYQGQDAVLQRPVAIKAPFAAHADMYRSALALTSALAHPAFLSLYDVIEQGDGLFLAYEFVEGRPLADYLTTGLPLRRALALMLQVTRALAYAHAHGVTHGDLTPSAILVDRAAVARVSNVGMIPDGAYFDDIAMSAYASGVSDDPDSTAATLSERVEYLDTWAAAVILWQLITDPNMTDSGPAHTRSYRTDMPDHLRDIIERALQVNHPEAITTSEALETELAALDAALAVDIGEEPVPATISALRFAREHATGTAMGAVDIAGMRWNGMGVGTVSTTATTSYGEPDIDELADEDASITQPSDDVVYQAQAPRLRLPSRPVSPTDLRLLGMPHAVAPASQYQQAVARSELNGWVWALISLAVFALCFLAGFLLMPVIPLPHLP